MPSPVLGSPDPEVCMGVAAHIGGAMGVCGPGHFSGYGTLYVLVCAPLNYYKITLTLTENPYQSQPFFPDLSTSGVPEERADRVAAAPSQ